MKLHRLEMIGFKSFCDRTVVTFPEGITAVVGPNGCGKSNIVDAIKWVLGEQSARSLRGSQMADVVFAGSDRRKPMGLAQVTLTFLKPDPEHPAKDIPVEVARRLFRSGEAEYLLNGCPCRLRDITEQFADTGIGLRAYSILEQGQVDQVIRARPEERRLLLEEAAGIMKYKLKRKAAESKLEETKENLVRFQDIFEEVKRQRNRLSGQAEKALKYKEFSTQLQDAELKLFAHRHRVSAKDLAEATAAAEAGERKLTGAKEEAERVDRLHEQAMEAKLQAGHALQEGEQDHYHNALEITRIKREGEVTQRLLEEDIAVRERASSDKDFLVKQRAKAVRDLTEQDELCERQKQEVETLDQDVAAAQQKLAERKAAFAEQEKAIEERRRQGLELLHRISSHRTENGRLDGKLHNLQQRLQRLETEAEEVVVQRGQKERQVEGMKERLVKDQARLAEAAQEIVKFSSTLKEQEQAVEDGRKALEALRRQRAESQARMHTLTELVERLEGFGEGPRYLMAEYRKRSDGSEDRMVLADCFQVPSEYDAAFEAVLAERFQAVVVESFPAAREGVNLLKDKTVGRGTLLPLDIKPPKAKASALEGKEGVLGLALSFVETDKTHRRLMEALLKDVILVADLDTAHRVWSESKDPVTCVTPEGDVLHADGSLTGGHAKKSVLGHLSQRRRIQELTAEVETLEAQIIAAEKAFQSSESGYKDVKAVLAEFQNQHQRLQSDLHHHSQDLERLQSELKRAQTMVETVALERRQHEEECERIKKEQARIAVQLMDLEDARADLERQSEELAKVAQAIKHEYETLQNEVSEAQAELSATREKVLSAERTARALRHRLKELDHQNKTEEERAQQAEARITAARDRLKEGRSQLETLAARQEGLRLELEERKARVETASSTLEGLHKARQEHHAALEEATERARSAEVRLGQLRVRMEQEESRILERYDVDLSEILARYEATIFNEQALQDMIQDARGRMAKLGPVNLAAIEEFEEVEQRFQFLSQQQTDLKESIGSLEEAIRKMNKVSVELFKATFEEVNGHFDTMFRKLFRGGRAQMVLTDPENLLETGIDIIVQPPGKRLQALTLLSGGEKALVTLALLVALFQHKPSPFCIMDEVDAPLDEANNMRFNDLIRELAQRTQMLVVTHSQRTMETGDVLYGVTMDEPGVSRLLTAQLKVA